MCLSRQELAELVNAWVWEHHHKMVELSANYIGQLERGKIRWPGRVYREALRAVLGDLAHRAGFMAFDAGAYEDAHRVLRFALACAEQADDWHLRAYVLDSMALQAIWIGRPDEGLTLTEQALVRADRLTETGQAMLHTDRGRALAQMRRVNETLTAVGTAEDHFAQSTPADDPPFLANYNAAFLAGNTGHALFDLALLGHHPAQATDRLTAVAHLRQRIASLVSTDSA